MPKAIPILILTTLLGLLSALWGWSEVITARGLLNEQIELREAAEARITNMQKQLRKTKSDYATAELRLRAIHSTTPDRPTDRRVYGVLCSRGNCAKVEPMPTPAD